MYRRRFCFYGLSSLSSSFFYFVSLLLYSFRLPANINSTAARCTVFPHLKKYYLLYFRRLTALVTWLIMFSRLIFWFYIHCAVKLMALKTTGPLYINLAILGLGSSLAGNKSGSLKADFLLTILLLVMYAFSFSRSPSKMKSSNAVVPCLQRSTDNGHELCGHLQWIPLK